MTLRAIILPVYFFFLSLSVTRPIMVKSHAIKMITPPLMRTTGITLLENSCTLFEESNSFSLNIRHSWMNVLASSLVQIMNKVKMDIKTITTSHANTEMTPTIVRKIGNTKVTPAKMVAIQVSTKKKFDHL